MKHRELTAWKEVQVNKLDLTRKLLEELKAQAEVLKKILKDKGEILEVKCQLHQAKEDTIKEYKELDGSFADIFDNCFRQVKVSFSKLDLSHISIDAQAQTPAHLIHSEGTNNLFAEDSTPNPQGGGETAHEDHAKPIEDESYPTVGNHSVGEKDGENPTDQQQIVITFLF